MELVAEPDESQGRCRICLEGFVNPPISPCNCTGGFFHKECLAEWIKVSQKKNCEVCLQEYNCVKKKLIYKINNIILLFFTLAIFIGCCLYVIITVNEFFIKDVIVKIVLYLVVSIFYIGLLLLAFHLFLKAGFFSYYRMVVE